MQQIMGPGRGVSSQAAVWTLAFVAALTAARIAVLFLGRIELYPEEAQYWLWSRHLAWGYFSKPPLIAWTIAATTSLGEGEGFVRLAAPLAHGIAALALSRAGVRLYGGWAGFWAAAIYSLAPGIQLSAAVIATDSLALAAGALAVWAYAVWLTDEAPRVRRLAALNLGLALGVGALAKYAIVYLALGLVLHALASPETRRRWRPAEVALTVGAALAVLAPNLIWNAGNGFQTLAHTAHDAAWKSHAAGAGPHRHADLIAARQAPGFLLAQLATFGPVAFVALILGAVQMWRRRRQGPPIAADVALLCLTAPALVLILAQAMIARANANWAAMAYAPASVLVAAWLLRWRAGFWLGLSTALGAALLIVSAATALSPALADRMGLANAMKRERGWEALTALVQREALAAGPAHLRAIAVDDRFAFNELAYYGRDSLKGLPPLRMWVREIAPRNEAETVDPLAEGPGRVLFVDVGGAYRAEAMADFAAVRPLGAWRLRLDRNPAHDRRVVVFVGQDYRRRPRDPRTGLPEPP